MRKHKIISLLSWVLLLSLFCGSRALADGADMHFGSEGYTWNPGDSSPVGIYVTSTDGRKLTEVDLVVSYDPDVLRFDSGEDEGVTVLSEGKFRISRSGDLGTEFRQLVRFTPLLSEVTAVTVENASAAKGAGSMADLGSITAEIVILMRTGCALEELKVDGKTVTGFRPEIQRYRVQVPEEEERAAVEAAGGAGAVVEISDTALSAGENLVYVTVANSIGDKARYTLEIVRDRAGAEPEAADRAGAEPEAADRAGTGAEAADRAGTGAEVTDRAGAEPEAADRAGAEPEAADRAGAEPDKANEAGGGTAANDGWEAADKGGGARKAEQEEIGGMSGGTDSETANSRKEENAADKGAGNAAKTEVQEPQEFLLFLWDGLPYAVRIFAAVLALMILTESALLIGHFAGRKRVRKRLEGKPVRKTKKRTASPEKKKENPIVIKADHVCMDFVRETDEASSFKELVIRTMKGCRSRERYRALDNISFEIRKGDVVGVMGTNGAGKSTLLKIISGALSPTAGRMLVDKEKVQILTMGTGFDLELTGKENIYLNGAIIGYEKEFIDEHYEQIVEFAELGEFINEKVKNYSSGMVSRLGFAIATVGSAAEILILDEVLSVGDKIFRQKSMDRIKEMIHGGSTVLMVSHSTETIRENCGKAIWIEKGHLITMGEAGDICAMYDRYDGKPENIARRDSQIYKGAFGSETK